MAVSLQINRDLCINSNYPKMHCDFCRQSCPLQCIHEDLTIDESLCNECGLCQSACPREAIFSTAYTGNSIEKWLKEHPGSVSVFCQRQDKASPWPCLGFLDARLLLVFAAGERKVVVNDRGCSSCKPGVEMHLQNMLANANGLLSVKDKPLIQQGEMIQENLQSSKSISRRDFFSQLFGATVDTVREAMGPTASMPERLPRLDLFRCYALQSHLSSSTIEQQVFRSLVINHAVCQACGLCVKICPNKAIKTWEEEGVLHFNHDPMACNGCGICAGNCPRQAASLMDARQLHFCEIAAVPLPRCSNCGQLFQPVAAQEVCFECLLKGKTQISQILG